MQMSPVFLMKVSLKLLLTFAKLKQFRARQLVAIIHAILSTPKAIKWFYQLQYSSVISRNYES